MPNREDNRRKANVMNVAAVLMGSDNPEVRVFAEGDTVGLKEVIRELFCGAPQQVQGHGKLIGLVYRPKGGNPRQARVIYAKYEDGYLELVFKSKGR